MSIILIDTFHHLSLSHPYTEPLEHYSVQISQPVSILFMIVKLELLISIKILSVINMSRIVLYQKQIEGQKKCEKKTKVFNQMERDIQ